MPKASPTAKANIYKNQLYVYQGKYKVYTSMYLVKRIHVKWNISIDLVNGSKRVKANLK